MNLMIVGNGGREHGLAKKLSQSPEAETIFTTSRCAGIDEVAEPIGIQPNDIAGLGEFALRNKVDFTIVGSEEPIAVGIADHFEEQGLQVLAPNQDSARIESSKSFSKNLANELGIPTAEHSSFTDAEEAKNYLLNREEYPAYIKADGPAAGKGAIEVGNSKDAVTVAEDILLGGLFGDAGKEIVVEDFLQGQEVSLHALSDGTNYIFLPLLQDYKKALENDEGPNTGSMGTVGPLPLFNSHAIEKLGQQFIAPVIDHFNNQGNRYKGALFAGIMLTPNGPKLLEYNARFGDSEAQVYMRLIKGDLLPILLAAHDGNLDDYEKVLRVKQGFVACINVVSGGYPGSYLTNFQIEGLDEAAMISGVEIFHAGTRRSRRRTVRSAGGRVLNITCLREELSDAIETANVAADRIHFTGARFRHDIGVHASKTSLK